MKGKKVKRIMAVGFLAMSLATTIVSTKNNASTVWISGFDHGYYWSKVDISHPDVYRFNSTHGVVHENNIYNWLDTRQETDW